MTGVSLFARLLLWELIVLASGTGAVTMWPELSGPVWFAVAAVGLALIPLTYLPEIRGWWIGRRGGGQVAQPAGMSADEAFRLNHGAGRVAASLIRVQPDVESATRVFDLFKAAPNKADEAAPYAALARRLIEAERSHDAEILLLEIPEHVSEIDREAALSEFLLSEDETH